MPAQMGRTINSWLEIENVSQRFADEASSLISFDRIIVSLVDWDAGTFTPSHKVLKADVSPKATSERLCHAGISLTMDVYARLLPGIQEEAAPEFSQLLADFKYEYNHSGYLMLPN